MIHFSTCLFGTTNNVDVLTPFNSKRLIYFLFRDYFQKPHTAMKFYYTLQNPVTFFVKVFW